MISSAEEHFFWDQVKGGRVAATGAAPPCETFAISRWADEGWHDRTHPVPLRSAYALWGRHDLTPKEQRQVRTSNVLLIYAIAFATLSAIYGIASWTEHPDLITRHEWLSAPSIWLLEQIRRIQALPNAHAHRLQHCTFGGRTRKPTRLLTVNLEVEMREELNKIEKPRAPTGCLIGKNPDGTWKTSQAKEYPRAMSAGIAAAMVRAACKHPRAQTNEDIEAAISKFADFQPQLLLTPEAVGADFVDSIAPVHRFIMQWHSPINPSV